MFRLAWRGVRNNAGRYIATLVAIMTGVAFFTATGFVSDRVIDALEGDVNRQYSAVDAAIVPDTGADAVDATFADQLRIPGEVVEQIKALPGVAAVGGDLTGAVAFLGADGKTFGDGATGRLWIADEPTGNLDSRSGAEVLGFLRRSVDEFGQTIVMVTHDPGAASYADRVLFLADVRIVDEMADPSADRVLERMKAFEQARG